MSYNDKKNEPPNMRYVDCCIYCKYADSKSVCDKHKVLIMLEEGPTICDDYEEYIQE